MASSGRKVRINSVQIVTKVPLESWYVGLNVDGEDATGWRTGFETDCCFGIEEDEGATEEMTDSW